MALDEIGIRLPDVDNLVAILTDPKTLQEDCAMKKDKIWWIGRVLLMLMISIVQDY